MDQEIIDKIEGIHLQLRENRDAIKEVNTNIELFALGTLIVGLLVGGGIALSKAIWIMFACGAFRVVYMIYRADKRNQKSKR